MLTLACYSIEIRATFASKSDSRIRADATVLTGCRFAWLKRYNINV